jgi:DNA-binding LytR/AlgR family response regulator
MIVDDEPIARDILINYTARVPVLNLVKICMNATEAFEGLHQYPVDLIFLDIQMPVITGVEFLRSLRKPPFVIFTTAHADFALEGYSLNGVDYLLKPITFERFQQAVQKAMERLSLPAVQPEKEVLPDYTFIKQDTKLVRINYDEVLYIMADRDYCYIYFSNGKKIMVGTTLKELEATLPDSWFIRAHRSYIINTKKITTIKKNSLEIDSTEIPIGLSYRESLFSKFQKFLK